MKNFVPIEKPIKQIRSASPLMKKLRKREFSPVQERQIHSLPARLISKLNKKPTFDDLKQIPELIPEFLDKNADILEQLRNILWKRNIPLINKKLAIEKFSEKHKEMVGIVTVKVEEIHETNPSLSLGQIILSLVLLLFVGGFFAKGMLNYFPQLEDNIIESIETVKFDNTGRITTLPQDLIEDIPFSEKMFPISSSILKSTEFGKQVFEQIPSYDQVSLIALSLNEITSNLFSGKFSSVKQLVDDMIIKYQNLNNQLKEKQKSFEGAKNETRKRGIKNMINKLEGEIELDPLFQITKTIQKLDPLQSEDTIIKTVKTNTKQIRSNFEEAKQVFNDNSSLLISIIAVIMGISIYELIKSYITNSSGKLELRNLSDNILKKLTTTQIDNWNQISTNEKLKIINKLKNK